MKKFSDLSLMLVALVFGLLVVLLTVSETQAQSGSRTEQRAGSDERSDSRDRGASRSRSRSRSSRSSRSSSRGGSSSRSTRSRRSGDEDLNETGDDAEEQTPLSAEAEAAIEKLASINQAIVQNRRAIDQAFRDLPIGFSPVQQEKQKLIDQLNLRGEQLEAALIEQGIAVFRLAPLREQVSTRIVLNKLSESLSPKSPDARFDPALALEITDLIREQTKAPWNLLMQAFKASYALQNFERAREILDELEEFGPVKDIYYEVLEETSDAWQEELATRRQESLTGDLPYAIVETSEGTFKIELFENQATMTVYDFVSRAEAGDYDGLPFFVVRPGEFARCGWSLETGQPANDTISSEAQKEQARKHFTGSVSMVTFDDQTTSSVFQICHQPNFAFNGKHTVFGRIVDFEKPVDGEEATEDALDEKVTKDALDIVLQLKPFDGTRYSAKLDEASKINKITIMNKRSHDYKSTIATNSAPVTNLDEPPEVNTSDEQSSSFDLLPQGSGRN